MEEVQGRRGSDDHVAAPKSAVTRASRATSQSPRPARSRATSTWASVGPGDGCPAWRREMSRGRAPGCRCESRGAEANDRNALPSQVHQAGKEASRRRRCRPPLSLTTRPPLVARAPALCRWSFPVTAGFHPWLRWLGCCVQVLVWRSGFPPRRYRPCPRYGRHSSPFHLVIVCRSMTSV